ncbi:MAG: peptidase [Cyclobacteriaceae bacterium]
MKYILSCIISLSFISAFAQQPQFSYDIDVTQNLDTFYVSLTPEVKIDKTSNIYQFAATAPGTYQTMNIGRFISDFKAFNWLGMEIDVERVSVNQFKIDKPHKVKKITYKVAETFDTEVEEYPIYLMAGSSIEDDHTLINTHTMIGYFEGYQKSPLQVKVVGKDSWTIGTALSKSGDYFVADDFDHVVDSPILAGDLTFAATKVADTEVEIYTYSAQGLLNSELLLANMEDMLNATNDFLIKLPVERYTFLYFFEPNLTGQTGAWEHSYSSEYVLGEKEPTVEFMKSVTDIASHEFFHIVTPLNIHSEVVDSFNFVEPTPSIHLWLYEGVTEWASNMLLYRGGVIDLQDYLSNSIIYKILVDERYFDTTWSLKKISDESFNGGEGSKQYGNIYYKGSLTAGLLDIRLLELSDGTYGLRELMLDLVEKYGKGNPVSEETFFDDIAAMTYPEIRDFFDMYVLEANPLPHAEYFAKIGLKIERDDQDRPTIIQLTDPTPQQQKLFFAWSENMDRQ